MARCCQPLAVMISSKQGASESPCVGMRQALRTMVTNSPMRVATLCAGAPDARRHELALSCADSKRTADAMGSRVALVSCSVSANISGDQSARIALP
jgi:hypothetical protein